MRVTPAHQPLPLPPPPLLVLALLLTVMMSPASGVPGAPFLCSNQSLSCECLDGEPYVVECESFDLTEFPLVKKDEFPFPWSAFLESNRIASVPKIPSQLQLIMLSLKNNLVSTIADSAFAELPQLRSLDLSHCRLTQESLTQDAFKGPNDKDDRADPLHPLELLDLSHNRIEALDGHAFNHLSGLKSLIISGNAFHDFSRDTCSAFSELTNLEELDLSRAELKRIPEQFLAGMRKLKKLVLKENKFVTVPQEVNFAKSLEVLVLDGNPIVSISPNKHSAFHGPPTLRVLSLSSMPALETISREAFTGLTSLTTVTIADNPRLESVSKLAFIGASNVREVYLQNNRLSTLSSELLDWDTVETLDLQHNPWQCDCHLQWFTVILLPKMVAKRPHETRYIVCAGPLETLGVNIKQLVRDEYPFPCPRNEGLPMNPSYYGPLIVATIFTGALLLLAATVLCTYVLYKSYKSGSLSNAPVRYRRTTETDLESIAQNIDA